MFRNGFLTVIVIFGIGHLNICHGIWKKTSKIGIEPGPLVEATKGEVWPKPQIKVTNEKFFIVRPRIFNFKIVGQTCDILEDALKRYGRDLRSQEKVRRLSRTARENQVGQIKLIEDKLFGGYMDELSVNLNSTCENMPHLDMDEHYELFINSKDFVNTSCLISQSIWGILRGLETWSQLIYPSNDFHALIINSTSIMDYPRFPHRGLLLDTSRHFLPVKTIFSVLDAMAMSKLNVFHWHIVDDQSFPYQSKTFPSLSEKGAYAPTHVYSQENVQDIVKYATRRGIRVIPEFDSPGHTRSWGEAFPELLTQCFSENIPDGSLGPINPLREDNYSFMRQFLKEIFSVFPDSYIHLGGDEVEFQCWASNPDISAYMTKHKMTVQDLESLYINKIIKIAGNMSARSVVWQEVFDDGVKLPEDTIVQIWKGGQAMELYEVTLNGYKTLLSSCWYLDALSSGGDWRQFYRCDPHDFPGSMKQKNLVIGGEACMWGEVVDVNNVLSRVWPRACAAAEKLWSSNESSNIGEAAARLEEHTCRMNRRRIPAQPPNGPGFCAGINYA